MIRRVLRSGKICVMVLGEVNKGDHTVNTVEVLLDVTRKVGGFNCETIIEDAIPKDRRVRKNGSGTRREWIIVLRKRI